MTMKFGGVLLAVALGLGFGGAAQAADWTVDPASSHISFAGTQVGAKFSGHFDRFTARITFDPAQPQAGSADVTIDMASAATGDSQRDTAMPQPEWFDIKKFPQAVFHVTGFSPRGGKAFDATGKLTIRDVTADVTMPFTLDIQGNTAHAVGHADLLRSTFAVGQGAWASDEYVAMQVGVDIDLTAHKAP